ncbi:hypothetical protein SK128_011578 [Halocaridina rubra]|uniref:Secreted protein n=1 Tax=Halocaridina rubra TaxID=373956 RepID=A0AAN8XRA8_HALRR
MLVRMYITTTLCFVGLMASGGALATYPDGGVPPKNPFFDSFLCNKENSIPVCELKKSQCAGINQVFIGPGGPVGAVINCANGTGAVPGPEFYLGIGWY